MKSKKLDNAKATLRMVRISPRKLNLIAGLIRNRSVQNAIVQLSFSKKRVAQQVKKCLLSAVANAENNFGLDVDNLVISEATVGKALNMKRMSPRAKGRGCRINKFFSNLYITVTEVEGEV